MMKWLLFTICVCWTSLGFATEYYVGGSGASDNNPGTSTQPFATIQKAASVAVGGDIVNIRSGIYRETITPANTASAGNPITFRADNGASVTISGLNTIDNSAWSVYRGEIYRANVALPAVGFPSGMDITNNTTLLAEQIFKDGDMMIEARWPKGVAQYTDLLTLSAQGTTGTRRFISQFGTGVFQPDHLQDNALMASNGFPLPSGGLTGATIVVTGWFITESRTITAHNGNQINFSGIWNTGADPAGEHIRKYYFLTHKLGLLTQQREWHYEGGALYFWQPGGGSPTNVEYKARNWGFDLRGKTGIVIQNLTFKGCEPATGNTSTSYCTIDNIRASFMNHTVRLDRTYWQGYGTSHLTGTKLLGPGNVFKNSEMKWAASQGVWIGAGGRVENNKFEYFGYDGMWGCPVAFWGMDNVSNIVVTKNTMSHLGRGAIDNGYAFVEGQVRNTTNNEISYNDMSDFSRLNQDGGAFYSWGYQNLAGDRFHHNWIHDLGAVKPPDGSLTDGIMAGIYFDMGSGGAVGQTPVTVDHNVFWNIGHSGGWTQTELADIYTLPAFKYSTKQPARYYNNTFWGNIKSYVTYQTTVVDIMRNNIAREYNFNWGQIAGNIANGLLGGNPLFVGSGAGGLAYRIQATSPAKDAGVSIPGITDGSVGTPDIGAYEYGGEAWVAGYTPVTVAPATNTPPVVTLTAPTNNATFAQGTAITLTATATDNESVSKVEFYDGSTKIGEDITSPYSFSWANATVGTHSLTAKATDNLNVTATSSVISITVTGTNTAPTVSITSPANGAQYTTGASVTITATAADAGGTVSKVEFFDGATKLGEDTSSPYSFAWANVTTGTHTLTAKATDNQSSATTSAAVTITVTAAPVANKPPTVSITAPNNNAKFSTGANITISATAADSDGTISKVEFYNGSTKLGEDTSSPYSFILNNAATGSYAITARATDNQNSITTSSAINITVSTNQGPNVNITSPGNNSRANRGSRLDIVASASHTSGTITKVEFFAGSTKLGEDLSSPYSYSWANLPLGTYAVTAKATDNLSVSTTSAPVTVIIVPETEPANVSPTVLIVSPATATQFNIGDIITIDVDAADSDGSLTNVEFYDGATKLGEDNSAPYQFVWNDSETGKHTLTAVATDNLGAFTQSDPIEIAVIDPFSGGEEEISGIPRFFSPNDDGTGDKWVWATSEAYMNASVAVFNRAGQQVYASASYDNSWDGKSGGQPLQDGDYYYVITLVDQTVLRGSVRIIR